MKLRHATKVVQLIKEERDATGWTYTYKNGDVEHVSYARPRPVVATKREIKR